MSRCAACGTEWTGAHICAWKPSDVLHNRWATFTDDEMEIICLAPFDPSIEVHRVFREGFLAELRRRRDAAKAEETRRTT